MKFPGKIYQLFSKIHPACIFSLIISALLIIGIYIPTQDGAPLLFQGYLFNEYITNNFLGFDSIYTFNLTKTSWIGVILSALSLKWVEALQAERILQLLHLALFAAGWNAWAKFLKLDKKSLTFWWLSFLPFFWSYIFSKGFYNYLYAVDFIFIAIPLFLSGEKKYLLNSILILLAALSHPLPVLIGIAILGIYTLFKPVNKLRLTLVLLPALSLLCLHFISIHSETNYTRFSLYERVGDLAKGLTIASCSTKELYITAIYTMCLSMVFLWNYIENKLHIDIYMYLVVLFLIIYFSVPQETSGGGLITTRIAWFISFFVLIKIVISTSTRTIVQKFTNTFIPATGILMIMVKIYFWILLTSTNDISCYKNIPEKSKLIRLYTAENPMRKEGWLIPFIPYQAQKIYIQNHFPNVQNHFACSDYYPFRFRTKRFEDELLQQKNIETDIYAQEFLLTDSIIVSSNFVLQCETLDAKHRFQSRIYKKTK